MNVAFRVDSSSQIGLGHLMRCLVLAKKYAQHNILFFVQDLPKNANYKIKDDGYKFVILENNNESLLINFIRKYNVDFLVIDHYGIDYQFEKAIKVKSKVKILSFDDMFNPHYCDILLNHNIYANDEQYKNLVPDFCELRCGEKYTLIRNEFKDIAPQRSRVNNNNPTVFVSMGGADSANVNLAVLKKLVDFKCNIILATTSSNVNINSLLEFAKKYSQVRVYVDHVNIARLMNSSNLAIVPSSVTVYEVMYLKLPFITIKTADNQEYVYQYLKQKESNGFVAIDAIEDLLSATISMGLVRSR